MNKNFKSMTIWIVVCSFIFIIIQAMQVSSGNKAIPITFSKFLRNVDAGNVKSVSIKGNDITGKLKDSKRISTYNPNYQPLVDRLMASGVDINTAPPEDNTPFLHILFSWLPLLILGGIWFFMIRQVQGGGGRAMSFGRSKAKLMEKKGHITFKDVAGITEAKQDLTEIVDFLKDPGKFKRLGGKIPRGVLLVGSPGTGKTLLARAIAGEASAPFFSMSGSEFVEMFVGVGASRVRDLFEQGKKHAPCIIFIDEIDAVGRHRGIGLGGGNDEREQTLNQLLVEMDGFEENDGVIIIAATNRPDVLDPALLRPGRFDRQVVVPLPDLNGREEILKVHSSKVPLGNDVDLRVIARGTPGFSGADLSNLVNEGALLAARRGKVAVGMDELEDSKDKVMMGAERRSMMMSDDAKKLTAYHEAGHAIVGVYSEGADPIHKATIMPRGRALGMVMHLPTQDRVSKTRQELEADLAVSAGGRIAEEMIFGKEHITTGASSDIQQATKVARKMVIDWGMSNKLGFLSYASDNSRESYLGSNSGINDALSDDIKRLIDEEVKNLVDTAYKRASKILKDHKDELHALANALLERETLTGEEINKVIKGEALAEKKEKIEKPKARRKTKMPVEEGEEN